MPMYSSQDLSVIFNPYFKILEIKEKSCTIQSVNTGHYWKIEERKSYYILNHKHQEQDSFHFQKFCPGFNSMEECFLDIADHDDFQLNGRKAVNKETKSFFDEVLKIYNTGISSCC